MSEWQDIKTLHKDQSGFLVAPANQWRYAVAFWSGGQLVNVHSAEVIGNATHWMEIPPPPLPEPVEE